MAELSLAKKKTAVIIADFYTESMNTRPHARDRKVVDKARRIQESARREGMLVCYTATVFRDGYPEISPHNETFAARKASGQTAVSDAASLIHPDVAPWPGEPVVGKHRVSGFFQTDLDMILRANGIETLVLMGSATSGVTLSMVRYGSDADYKLVVVEDCCADPEPDVHNFLMERIFPSQATIASSEDVIKAIAG